MRDRHLLGPPCHSVERMQTHEAEASAPPKHSLSVTNHKRISQYPRGIDPGASNLDVGARRHRQSTARALSVVRRIWGV